MKLNCKIAWLKTLKKKGGTDFAEDFRWRNDDQWSEIEIEKCSEKDLELLVEIAQASAEKGSKSVLQKISMFHKLRADLTGTKISRLEALQDALRAYVGKSPRKWVFEEQEDGQVVPWYVRSIKFHEYDDRREEVAHTEMCMSATRNGAKVDRTSRWEVQNLGDSVVALLQSKGLYLETPEAVETYEKQMEHYQAIQGLTGEQFWGQGYAFEHGGYSRYYRSNMVSLERDGVPARLVMDDMVKDDEEGATKTIKRNAVSSAYWLHKKEDAEGLDTEDKVVEVPVQPYVNVFDLEKHTFYHVHTSNLKAYEYDSLLINKLILPTERKDLISILVAGADVQLEDIVRGKTGGIIVICTGPPGTGKTLTAEVFSELVKRPLYCVQCSQLGTNEEALEKELNIVLSRSVRWKAILLIDEADVYTHERGEDIQQNAIVGVFLRVLEHYRGVMFMTSNRDTIIDDAIMSRATASIKYDYPDTKELPEIWRVLSENYEVELTKAEVTELCKIFPKISGRSIKNLLRLGRLLVTKKGGKVDVKLLQYVSQFIDLDGKSRKVNALAMGR